MENDQRVIRAVAFIDNALRYIDKKGYTSAWCRDCAVNALKTARTLLQNTKDDYAIETRHEKIERESIKLLRELIDIKKRGRYENGK